MQDTTYSSGKQYASIETGLQACLVSRCKKELKVFPDQKSMTGMTTFELTYPYPFLLTVLNVEISLETADISSFHEQYRRCFDRHLGIWLIIALTPGQYDFIRQILPVGHNVTVVLMQSGSTKEEIADKTFDFFKKSKQFEKRDKMGLVKLRFYFDSPVCSKCGSSHRVITGIRMFKNTDPYGTTTDSEPNYTDIPVGEFSYTLRGYAGMLVNTSFGDTGYICSMCGSPMDAKYKESADTYEASFMITADDCLRYML